ncbi:MAG TPA: SDR family oxidoreductase [Pseudolabrys sp.]|nr:SDR family oxidoreductase [Pseudolabrys sp.]
MRVNATFADAVATRVASGIEHFDGLLNETARKSPLCRTMESCEVGRAALLLASDYMTAITGEVLHIDGGFYIEGMVFH